MQPHKPDPTSAIIEPLLAPRDVSVALVAHVYAEAIVEAAEKRNCRDEVVAELKQLASEVLPRVPGLLALLDSPRLGITEKAAVVDKAMAGRVSETTRNTLQVLANHQRLGILPEIVAAVSCEVDRLAGKRQAIITTAQSLDDPRRQALLAEVERALGTALSARFTVNPDLLGGLVVRVEDTVYDQSVATGLVRLAERLKQRSIHEIQHRRDRLGSA
jgi:F-type H+-transporting ATPase subunit delta